MRVAVNSVAIAAFVFAVVIASNCGDPVPAPAPAPVTPSTVRTFDVTTVLDSFSFETGGSSPDCGGPTNPTPYCTHYRAFSGATLTGTFTTSDTFPELPRSGSFKAMGLFDGQFCDDIDYGSLTGCLHVAPTSNVAYSGTLTLGGGAIVSLIGPKPPCCTCNAGISLSGVPVGDSLVGRVWWFLCGGRSPPSHRGRFVARLRK